jgi:hypothetical protein
VAALAGSMMRKRIILYYKCIRFETGLNPQISAAKFLLAGATGGRFNALFDQFPVYP